MNDASAASRRYLTVAPGRPRVAQLVLRNRSQLKAIHQGAWPYHEFMTESIGRVAEFRPTFQRAGLRARGRRYSVATTTPKLSSSPTPPRLHVHLEISPVTADVFAIRSVPRLPRHRPHPVGGDRSTRGTCRTTTTAIVHGSSGSAPHGVGRRAVPASDRIRFRRFRHLVPTTPSLPAILSSSVS